MSWQIAIPTRIVFGAHALNAFERLASDHLWHRVLLIMGKQVARQAFALEFVERLANLGLDLQRWTDTEANPKVHAVEACVVTHRDPSVDVVVGLGGGSTMDQAKATAVGLCSEAAVGDLLAGEAEMPSRRSPLVLIPTTAGAGSETSWGAILTDTQRGTKSGLRGQFLAADYAIVDPACTLELPIGITMTTGFDVLAHALETYLSSRRTEYTTLLSRCGIETVFACLPKLAEHPSDWEARRRLAFASTMAGINLALSTTCLPHRLQYPLGALTDSAHAEGLAAFYPTWLRASLPNAQSQLAECCTWVDPTTAAMPVAQRAESFVCRILDLMDRIGMRRRLADFGVDQVQAKELASQVTGNLTTDPGETTPAAVEQIYVASV